MHHCTNKKVQFGRICPCTTSWYKTWVIWSIFGIYVEFRQFRPRSRDTGQTISCPWWGYSSPFGLNGPIFAPSCRFCPQKHFLGAKSGSFGAFLGKRSIFAIFGLDREISALQGWRYKWATYKMSTSRRPNRPLWIGFAPPPLPQTFWKQNVGHLGHFWGKGRFFQF